MAQYQHPWLRAVYVLFGCAGAIHLVYGVHYALSALRTPSAEDDPATARRSPWTGRLLALTAASLCIGVLGGIAGFSGYRYPIKYGGK